MSGFNAAAAEWTPNVNAAEWTPSFGGGAVETAAAPVATESWEQEANTATGSMTAEQDALMAELSELLAAGEISQAEFDEAVAEAKGMGDTGFAVPVETSDTLLPPNAEIVTPPPKVVSLGQPKKKEVPEKEDAKKPADPTPKAEEATAGADAVDLTDYDEEKIPPCDFPPPDARSHMNVVFIGHVDAGKSTISGQILYLTGQVDARTIEKFEREAKERNRESWYMAYIMDTNEEERAKGKTVEVGMAHFESEKNRFTILDAPGHKNYVPNMISGAAQADIGVLVISARKGEFEAGFDQGGQTREHAMLAYTLGVQKLIIFINKMDTCDWSEKRFTEIKKKLAPFLKSCGYKPKRDCIWMPASGLHGLNLAKPLDDGIAPWYTDRRCLIEILDGIQLTDRNEKAGVRIPILECFSDRGTWIMGKVEQGTIRVGAKYLMQPNRSVTQVEEVVVKDDSVAFARPGENVRVRLKGLSESSISKGFVLSSIKNPIPIVSRFRGVLQVIETLDHRPIISPGYKCIFHCHTGTEECIITKILCGVDAKTGKPDPTAKKKFLRQKEIAYIEISLQRAVCIHTFEQMKQMGRFTLRDEQLSIAIGKIMTLAEKRTKG